jgi:hypothetical protein
VGRVQGKRRRGSIWEYRFIILLLRISLAKNRKAIPRKSGSYLSKGVRYLISLVCVRFSFIIASPPTSTVRTDVLRARWPSPFVPRPSQVLPLGLLR